MSDPRPSEFEQFHELLTENAPGGYQPWYFRVRSGSKAPATSFGSWKNEDARLSYEEALEWLEDGGNVGIAGTADDELVNVDIDDEDATTPDDLKETLTARSRSRTGVHAWYFETADSEIPNIPTDEAGEVRANWQYVVAPGSYVDTEPEEVPDEHSDDAGYYTVERPNSVTSLRFEELPTVFKEHHEATQQQEREPDLQNAPPERDGGDDGDRSSDLFEISAREVVQKEGGSTDDGDRWSAIWHQSDTGSNMNLSSKGLIQCWRHNVAHNGLQALVTLSDYKHGCEKVGVGHKNANKGSESNAGDSCIKNEDGAAVWHAWKYAKENGYIPDDDPVPYSALMHVCRERELCTVAELPDSEDETLPQHAYDGAIESIENYDELNSGRKRTDEIDDSGGIPDKNNVERIETPDNTDETGEPGKETFPDPDGDTEQQGNFGSISDLVVFGGGYGYIKTTDSGEEYFERVTNFEIDVESGLERRRPAD